MGARDWFRPPRHLLALFFGITVVSTAALAWLGWQLVQQDRALAVQRSQEQRDSATALAVAALQKHLSEVEERLTALAVSSEPDQARLTEFSRGFAGDSLLLVFNPHQLEAFPAGRLLYYPIVSEPRSAPSEPFATADALEFETKDYSRAVEVLRALAQSRNTDLRAEAMVRLGRNLRHAGRWEDAVTVYEHLAELDSVRIRDIPANLLAQAAICDVLVEHGRNEGARQIASTLYQDLQNGRWRLSRPMYDAYTEQIHRVLGSPAAVPNTAIAEAAQSLWEEWQSGKTVRARQTLWSADRPILAIARGNANRMMVLVAGAGNFPQWLAEVESVAATHNTRIALTDSEDHPVIGRVEEPATAYSLRLGSTTGLPWTVHGISERRDADIDPFSFRSRLVMAGLAAIAVLVLGGSYLIGSAVMRELAVARQQSDFVTAISHEFRTPLTALRQLSELLAKGRVINEDVRQQYYDVLEHESTRLQRLVEGLLKFGRMEAGAMRYQFETIDAVAMVRALVDEYRREADRHGYRVEVDASGGVPPVRADREALGCAVWNLLDNAVKYSPDCPTVWVAVAQEGDRVAIRVRDGGVGISHDDRQRIFQKFVRGDIARALGVQGAGIGLSVAHQIVAGHGGEIQVQSEAGVGSTFSVLLPGVES